MRVDGSQEGARPSPPAPRQAETGSAASARPAAAALPRRALRRTLLRGAILGAVVGAALVVCRTSIGWFYPVVSGSMEPTVMTGEWVFLRYDRRVPDRSSIVAFRDSAGLASIKRAYGLPDERVSIDSSGDVLIDARMIHAEDPASSLVPLFDSSIQPIEGNWRHGGTELDPWSVLTAGEDGTGEAWRLDGRLVGRGQDVGLLGLHAQVDDGWLGPEGERRVGDYTVHDAVCECEMRVTEPGGAFRIQLIEEGDKFELLVTTYPGSPEWRIYLLRQNREILARKEKYEYLALVDTAPRVGEWTTVRFANVNNRLSVEFAGERIDVDYDRNLPNALAVDDRPLSIGERVKVGGGEGIGLEIRNLRVFRDLHIVPRGGFGVQDELILNADEIFVLGDASASSRDSRDGGPISLDDVIGRVEWVVWPLSSFRKL